MIQALRKITLVMAAGLGVLLSGCGGGGDSAVPTVAGATLGGTAAVGFPIVGGAVTVKCAGGSNLTTTTSATGVWTVTVSGQSLPCAMQVSNGTINGAANATPYQSLATSFGIVNVSPLTDLLFANLLGSATPGTLFGTLTPAQITAITPAQIATALTNLRAALQLTALNNIDPITLAFNATPGVLSDDILSALRTAIANAATTYQVLLASAGGTAGAGFALPTAFTNALASAYSGTTSGGGGGSGSGAGGTLPAGVSGKAVTMTFCCAAAGAPYTNGQQVLFTFSSSGGLFLTNAFTTVSNTFTVTPSNEYQWIDAGGLRYTLSLFSTGPNIGQINEVNINNAAGTFLGQFNTPVSAGGGSGGGTGLTLSTAFNGLLTFADSAPTAQITPSIGAQFQYRQTSSNPVVAAEGAKDFLDVTYLTTATATTINIQLNVGTPIVVGGGTAVSYAMLQSGTCTLTGTSTGAAPPCVGIAFDKVAGPLTLTNRTFGATQTVNGSLTFTPF